LNFRRLTFLGLLVFLLPCSRVAGQVINTEEKRNFQRKEGWMGSADLGMTFLRNTRNILQLSSRITAQYNHLRHTLLLINDLNFLKVDSAAVQNSGFQHVRYNYRVKNFLIPEAFVQAQYNQVWNLRLRLLVGAGPRFQILRNDSNRIFVGSLVMYEVERVTDRVRPNREVRSSSYLSVGIGLRKNLTFESTTYYQPLLRDFRDFRVSSESALTAAITKRLGFKATFGVVYDSRPPDGRTRVFLAQTNGVTFRF
jgi:putative salt-induced outer membrane protein YdiY